MKTWHPSWWNDSHGGAWDRIKEAIERDWEQTKHDFHLKGGHELNQNVKDTVAQSLGKEPLPPIDKPNPPKVIGSWNEAELPVGYGYGARQKYGTEHPTWNDDVESTLSKEWEQGATTHARAWSDVKPWVRYGYEYKKS